MTLKVIENNTEYENALKQFQKLFHSKSGSNQENRAKILALLIEDYENKTFHLPEPDPIEAIKFMMEQSNMNLNELSKIIGNKGNLSKVLNKKRKLSLDLIRKIKDCFNIPAETLIKDYNLSI